MLTSIASTMKDNLNLTSSVTHGGAEKVLLFITMSFPKELGRVDTSACLWQE